MDCVGFDLPEVDIRGDLGVLGDLAGTDWIVNCAAYTDVDGAESDRETAFAVNAAGAGRLARVAAARDVRLLHVSTDYVFDGALRRPYREDDMPGPINVYGESKLAGEAEVAAAGGRSLIVRTQSLYGPGGRHFVGAIRGLLQKGDQPLRVVNDQTTCPTYTGHLAAAILRLLAVETQGIVHVSASGECTWHAFARAIAEQLRPGAVVDPVSSDAFPRPARRPAYGVLDKGRYEEWTGVEMPSWEDGLAAFLNIEPARSASRSDAGGHRTPNTEHRS
jgi:dTDP-4-dehydrorhamnose reductase